MAVPLPIPGMFMPLPLPMMIAFMGIQSAVMAKQFGENFQYGKRRISAMSNAEFNSITMEKLLRENTNELKRMIPTMEESMKDMSALVPVIIREFGNMAKLAGETVVEQAGGSLGGEQNNPWSLPTNPRLPRTSTRTGQDEYNDWLRDAQKDSGFRRTPDKVFEDNSKVPETGTIQKIPKHMIEYTYQSGSKTRKVTTSKMSKLEHARSYNRLLKVRGNELKARAYLLAINSSFRSTYKAETTSEEVAPTKNQLNKLENNCEHMFFKFWRLDGDWLGKCIKCKRFFNVDMKYNIIEEA